MLKRALAVILLVALALAALPACSSGGGGGYALTAYFDKTVSLYPKSRVKILGLSSGRIDSVDVVGTQVRVRMTIDKDVPLPADVQATIVPLSLIGERYVQLFPAWTVGEPQLPPGSVIPIERTSIPVEPDQALAALKKFLDALDPNATGRLVHNLAQDLQGNGTKLNDALAGLANLANTLADKDQQIVGLVQHFDQFTATLRTREGQLGKVMDQFAAATKLLSDERQTIERLIKGLASVSSDGLDLVGKHAPQLNTDIETLTHTLEIVNANLDSVRQFLTATPLTVAGQNLDGKQGLAAAYDPTFHHLDLRNQTTPTLALLLNAIGIPSNGVCIPIDVTCPPDTPPLPIAPPGALSAPRSGRSASPPQAVLSNGPAVTTTTTTTPVDTIVGFLGNSDAGTRPETVYQSKVNPPAVKSSPFDWVRRAA
ncbi:MAG TPA: MCE family protein, partial [Acidimicrobiales bacterium]|nr:MCE family protein [Acidimicrobiales bacterium]